MAPLKIYCAANLLCRVLARRSPIYLICLTTRCAASRILGDREQGAGTRESGVRLAASREHRGFKARSLTTAYGVASTPKRGSPSTSSGQALLRRPAVLVTIFRGAL